MRKVGLALAGSLLLTGCASRQFYRLTKINGVAAIAPPGYRDSERMIRVRLAGVMRDGAAGRAECGIALPEFKLTPQRGSRDALAGVDLDALVPAGAYDAVARETFDKIKLELEAREDRSGCLAAGATQLIAARLAESLPMPFQDIAFYRNGYDAFRASVDLLPGMRVAQQVVVQEGDSHTDAVFYEVASRNGSDVDLRTLPGTQGAPVARKSMPHYRLFLRTRFINEPGNKPERNAVLLGGSDLASLFAATPKLLEDPEAVCGAATSAVTCTVFPHRFSVAPEVPVSVRGKTSYVDVVATLGQLRPPKAAINRIRVRRLYAGKRVKLDLKGAGPLVLKLPLAAGDEVTW